MTYSTTQVIMPQASGVRFPAESATGSAADAGRPRGDASRNCGTRPRGDADSRYPGHRAGRQQLDCPIAA